MLRPDVEVRADRRVRHGLRVPIGADRGPRRPTASSSSRRCRRCSATSTRTRTRSSPTRTAGVIVTDGRNHVELTDETYDIIVTDPPPPIESSGASVISSLEYYQAGHARLNPGGVMMQWTPYGSTVDEFKAHLRTFSAVFPHVIIRSGRAATASTCSARDEPMTLDDANIDEVLARPGILDEISSAYDSPAIDRRRVAEPPPQPVLDRRRRRHGIHRRRTAHHRRPAAPRVLPPPKAVRRAVAEGLPKRASSTNQLAVTPRLPLSRGRYFRRRPRRRARRRHRRRARGIAPRSSHRPVLPWLDITGTDRDEPGPCPSRPTVGQTLTADRRRARRPPRVGRRDLRGPARRVRAARRPRPGHGHDTGPFVTGLEDRGFEVADRSRSRPSTTGLVLASMLNAAPITDLGFSADVALNLSTSIPRLITTRRSTFCPALATRPWRSRRATNSFPCGAQIVLSIPAISRANSASSARLPPRRWSMQSSETSRATRFVLGH